ncbi:hypothetical protein CC86DRAFT_99909 [Ophiobolus disseminans]|uniref:C2H2-type domain-containing protein n=1 Tax=Ophiobolus disseminans TaxID=1469910 RepID=A0A6A6ZM32_9PLEO|nr:hypothetical protein CC86DRAFT_99909 [Ophiobolus disseminans]
MNRILLDDEPNNTTSDLDWPGSHDAWAERDHEIYVLSEEQPVSWTSEHTLHPFEYNDEATVTASAQPSLQELEQTRSVDGPYEGHLEGQVPQPWTPFGARDHSGSWTESLGLENVHTAHNEPTGHPFWTSTVGNTDGNWLIPPQVNNSQDQMLDVSNSRPWSPLMQVSEHNISGMEESSQTLLPSLCSGSYFRPPLGDMDVHPHTVFPSSIHPWQHYPIVPDSSVTRRPSPTLSVTPSSTWSATSQTTETLTDVLPCLVSDCPKTFAGRYRRGNQQRHMRLKHRSSASEERSYPCEACGKTFMRQDARLKHLRIKHPERGIAAYLQRRATVDIKTEEQTLPTEIVPLGLPSEQGIGEVSPLGPCMDIELLPDRQVNLESQLIASEIPSQGLAMALRNTADPSPANSNVDSSTVEDRRLECDLCESTFLRLADLRRHEQKHEDPAYRCSVPGCDRSFYRIDKLRDHVRQAHKADILTTDEGPMVIDVPEEPPIITPSSFPCTEAECSEVFQTAGLLKKHINRKHVRRYTCNSCGAAFHLNTDLKRHQTTVHELDLKESYPCPNEGCTQTFARRDNLTRHARHCKHAPDASTEKEPD